MGSWFNRVRELPRRTWQEADDLDELTECLTEDLKTPDGEMELWPTQAAALRDLHDHKGLFAPIGVGQGKALISLLAPTILQVERPLLLVPAQLREQTNRVVLPQMRRHWNLHPNLLVKGYSELSLEKNATMLEDLNPDMIIADECHFLKHKSSGRTKRVLRYMTAHEDTIFVALSGTVTTRSIMDYHHLLLFCLKYEAPLPLKWNKAQAWNIALTDWGSVPMDKGSGWFFEKVHPFDLLCRPEENLRQGYRRRLTQTPGVIASDSGELGTSLVIQERSVSLPRTVIDALHNLRRDWIAPNGDEISEPIEMWRYARQLAQGFYYKWVPPGPPDWMAARKAWKKYVRNVILYGRRKLDTELQVAREAEADAHPLWEKWKAIRDTFEINTVPVWLDDFLLEDAARWLRENEGIAWVEHRTVGQRLAQISGAPYYGAGTQASREILSAGGPIIASITAHSEGKNLQHYSKNLIVSCPTSGKTFEQLLGRTHRHGQLADAVECEVYLHTAELVGAMTRSVRDAIYLKDTLGSAQKLLYAQILLNQDDTWLVQIKKATGHRSYHGCFQRNQRSTG